VIVGRSMGLSPHGHRPGGGTVWGREDRPSKTLTGKYNG
jgi:hypothetical protein